MVDQNSASYDAGADFDEGGTEIVAYNPTTDWSLYNGVPFFIFMITKSIDKFEYIYIAFQIKMC